MEEYEKIQQENKKIIKQFEDHLQVKGINNRNISNHISNIDLFINEYLAGYDEIKPHEAGEYEVESFLRWCIDKWMFNTASGLVSALSSIKIFYEFLKEKGVKEDIKGIVEVYKEKDQYVKKFYQHEKLLDGY